MATIKVNYVIQSCPRCGKKLLKVAQGGVLIGSPMITCKKCGQTYKTDLRVEWDDYPAKWQVWGLPILLPVLMFVIGAIMANAALGIMAAIVGLLISLGFFIKDGIRILKSKKRMKDPAYINQLFAYGIIGEHTREIYLKNAE